MCDDDNDNDDDKDDRSVSIWKKNRTIRKGGMNLIFKVHGILELKYNYEVCHFIQ